MISTRILLAFFLAHIAAAESLIAQDGSEFDRTSGGQIEALSKHPRTLSGSLGMMLGSNFGKGYEATLGGTLVEDRLWFFASAHQQQMARPIDTGVTFGKVSAQLGDRNSLIASLGTARDTGSVMMGAPVPSSFLSLRYMGTVSSNMFFTAAFSRR